MLLSILRIHSSLDSPSCDLTEEVGESAAYIAHAEVLRAKRNEVVNLGGIVAFDICA